MIMSDQTCESALVDICTKFLIHLDDMKRRGVISQADYERHSMMKVKFLNQVKKGQVS